MGSNVPSSDATANAFTSESRGETSFFQSCHRTVDDGTRELTGEVPVAPSANRAAELGMEHSSFETSKVLSCGRTADLFGREVRMEAPLPGFSCSTYLNLETYLIDYDQAR